MTMRIVERRVTLERGALATDARELRCPFIAGCRGARLSLTARRQAAGERRGEGEPVLDRRAAPSHPTDYTITERVPHWHSVDVAGAGRELLPGK